MTRTEPLTPGVDARRAPAARYWSPAQLIAPAMGCVFVLWGLINIGHSGFHPEHVFEPHDALAGLHYTPFLASLEVGFGVAMLVGGALLRAARTQIRTLNGLAVGLGMVIVTLAGGAALGLGIVILIDAWPAQVHHWLNADHRDAVLYLVAGAVALSAAIASPFVLAPAAPARPDQPAVAPTPEPTPDADPDADPHPKEDLVSAGDTS
jgi:hypothetical protein